MLCLIHIASLKCSWHGFLGRRKWEARGSSGIIHRQPNTGTALEEQGSKRHFKYTQQDTEQYRVEKIAAAASKSQGTLPEEQGTNWLFKYPQQARGQHWAEKIAAEVAKLLEVLHAKVELAAFSGERGSVTESFVRVGQELVHGNQLLEGVVHGYDPEKKFYQSRHTLANIWQVMDRVFVEPDAARRAKLRIAGYLVLDALIW